MNWLNRVFVLNIVDLDNPITDDQEYCLFLAKMNLSNCIPELELSSRLHNIYVYTWFKLYCTLCYFNNKTLKACQSWSNNKQNPNYKINAYVKFVNVESINAHVQGPILSSFKVLQLIRIYISLITMFLLKNHFHLLANQYRIGMRKMI